MVDFVLYCKSYKNDLDRVMNLYKSINEFNVDKIPFYVSAPTKDLALFSDLDGVHVISDDDIIAVGESGWIHQQLVKANFWKLGIASNYLCLDSDSYFIRPFTIRDFMYDNITPYTVMHEQKELFSWTSTRKDVLGFDPKQSFIRDREKIMYEVFDRSGRCYDFGPSPVIWSAKVWKDLEDSYMKPNGLRFEDLIAHSPSEFSWYGEALLKFKSIELYPVEPLFKVFHYPQQYNEYKQQSITEDMIAQNYMGIVMQSNYNPPLTY